MHFKSRARRDELLKSCKDPIRSYNENLSPEERVYINEHLSPGNKRLFAIAIKKKHELGFKFVWSRNGSIFMKKDEFKSSVTFKITCDEDFDVVA